MKVIVIVGPTGIGKTRLSIDLAKRYNGEIISGDSMQIYQQMDIGTAKVTIEEMDGVPHHLINVKTPFESYSVSEFQTSVREKMKEITNRGHMPIIVGGTGLYVKAVLYDYVFEEADINHENFNKRYENDTNDELYERLKQVDPKSASILHPNNRRRVLRALEIFESTGQTKSASIDAQQHQMIYDAYIIGLTTARPLLHERINKRVDIMMANGLEDEVKSLIDQGCTSDLQSMKAIGYREWFDYFNDQATKEDVIEKIKVHSRQYAKRQYTWFKNQMDVNWFDVDFEHFEKTEEAVEKEVDKWI
ncbi:MAG: tRNA (adenosine(37)-N6)-dimethylallyltransferase MiaA [Erysipelotrichaceae bacterium]|nr:tRNA (adenosine(37)-N6)-dimethylallyltransferase MiaA [Erysipelotrichaceae bacterium]